MTMLELIASRDSVRHIWACLTPNQQITALLRIEGLTDPQIARLLGLASHAVVSMRMTAAKRRILRRFPDLADTLDGRMRTRGRVVCGSPAALQRTPPLERGYLCRIWDPDLLEEDR